MNRREKKRATRQRKRSRQWTLRFKGMHDRWTQTARIYRNSTYGKKGGEFYGGSYELMANGDEVINGVVQSR